MLTSVVEAVKAFGLYRETGRIEEQILKTIAPNGEVREHRMAEIDYKDLIVAADELDIALSLENKFIQSLFAKNAVLIINTIRCVNVESASGFKGTVGSGRQLDMILFRAQQFYNPDNVGVKRTTWERAIASTGSKYFIEGSTAASNLTMADEEAIVLLGFTNYAELPVCNAIQLTYLSQDYNIQNLDFGVADYMNAYPVLELKQPLIVFPKETIRGQVYYFATGTDWLQPVGVWIKMSENLRALATS